MSQLTECTCVIKLEDTDNFLKDYAKWKDIHRINEFKLAYKNDLFAIYIFDCNGDNIWMMENTKVKPLISETNYGYDIWTDGIGKTKRFESVNKKDSCINRLKRIYNLSDKEYETIKHKTAYSFY